MRKPCCFETSVLDYSVTPRHIPEKRNPQLHYTKIPELKLYIYIYKTFGFDYFMDFVNHLVLKLIITTNMSMTINMI